MDRLAGLMPNVMASGHGQPLVGLDAAGALQQLADTISTGTRAHGNGRHGRTPAYADENGVVSMPPPVVGTVPKVLAGAAVAGAVLYALSRRKGAA